MTHLFLSDAEILKIKEYVPQAVGFYEKMGALQDGVSRSLIDGRDIPRFIYCIKQGTCLDLKSCP